jgi:hypothetical protein
VSAGFLLKNNFESSTMIFISMDFERSLVLLVRVSCTSASVVLFLNIPKIKFVFLLDELEGEIESRV